MVNRRDVLELVASGEGSGVEFKQSMDSNRRLAQEVVAFRAELQPVSGAAFDELDLRRLNEYFRDIRGQDVPEPEDRPAWERLLVNTEYLELALYRDRLEVISPGQLPNGITPDRMRQGTRAARNQLIKDTLRDYGLTPSPARYL